MTPTLDELVQTGAIKPERKKEIDDRTAAVASRLKRPLRDGVLVRLRPRERSFSASILLHTQGKERNLWADVLAVGPGAFVRVDPTDPANTRIYFRQTTLKPGDVVRLERLRLPIIEDFGDDGAILIVPEFEFVLGVLEDASKEREAA